MKKRILAIDDSKAIRFLLQTVLSKDYQVVTAPDGCSAMHWLLKNELPHLIVCDVQLPDMNDWELIEHLATSGLYRDIPLVVVSSVDKSELDIKCQQFGISAHFSKPFNPVELLHSIDGIFNGTPSMLAQKAAS